MNRHTRQRIGKTGVFTLGGAAATFFLGAIISEAAEDLGWTWALVCTFGPLAFVGLFMFFLFLWTGTE